jgi:glycosyltransferase involved in cell wall biosynthesis
LFGAASYIVSAFFELMRLARAYKYDVYHFYFGLPTAILALYVHFVLRKPYIIALRGSDVPGYDDTKWYMKPLHLVLRPLSRFLWKHASAVTVLSKNLQDLARVTQPNLDSVIIGNGVDDQRFPNHPLKDASPVRLISVCRMVPRKGLEYLIDAMDELKNDGVTLELVGSGQDEQRMADLIRSRGLERFIKMSGYVRSERLHAHYNRAHIFVLPSLSESFGQVLIEAMSCGLPVVATAIGGIPETIRDKTNGLLVPPRDPAALVAAVRWLAANPKQRERMGRYNAEQARERYSWPAIATKYETLYYRAVGHVARSAAVRNDRSH